MNILEITSSKGYLFVKTDNPGRPDFVYHNDKFRDLEMVKKEVLKSIECENKKKLRTQEKVSTVLADFAKEKNVFVEPVVKVRAPSIPYPVDEDLPPIEDKPEVKING